MTDLHADLDPIAGEGTTTKTPAKEDVKYWGGAPQPWRNGTDDGPITDPDVIAREEGRKAAAEDEDASAAPTTEAHAKKLHGDGICIAFLLYLTFAFNLWEWQTWEVVQFLIKPATERHGRCRFADLPYVKPFTGPATVFASHCWGGRWGDLVAAVCAGADTRRVVWIDIFAVRQWPGNVADLDFRGVIARVTATLVAVAPVEGKLTEGFMADSREREAFLASREYQDAAKVLAFCRLWCIVEMFATLESGKHLVFRGAKFESVDREQRVVHLAGGEDGEEKEKMVDMLDNIKLLVNVKTAECAVPEDRVREMGKMEAAIPPEQGGLGFVNKRVQGSIGAGRVAVEEGIAEVDNFMCGEEAALRMLPVDKVEGAVKAACAAGLVEVVQALFDSEEGQKWAAEARRVVVEHYAPLYTAAGNGRVGVVELLLGVEGVDVNQAKADTGSTPLYIACQYNHLAVVERLLAHPATDVNQVKTGNVTPLIVAADKGHFAVVKVLLEKGADPSIASKFGTSLSRAEAKGHGGVAALLRSHQPASCCVLS